MSEDDRLDRVVMAVVRSLRHAAAELERAVAPSKQGSVSYLPRYPQTSRTEKGLTHRQEEVLLFIVDTVKRRGFPPTVRDIGAAFNIGSTNGVADHLDALERKGWISRDGTARGMRVLRVPDVDAGQKPESATVNGDGR